MTPTPKKPFVKIDGYAQEDGKWLLPGQLDLEGLQTLLEKALFLTPYAIQGPFGVSLCLADDSLMKHYNGLYRQKPTPTDVLSFPTVQPLEPWIIYEEGRKELGDILLNIEDIQRFNPCPTLQEAHAAHLLVHGFLHLLHYDHETDAQAQEMQAIEIKTLALYDWPNPYGEG